MRVELRMRKMAEAPKAHAVKDAKEAPMEVPTDANSIQALEVVIPLHLPEYWRMKPPRLLSLHSRTLHDHAAASSYLQIFALHLPICR